MLNRNDYFSDSVRHAEGGMLVPVHSTDWKVACSSPTQRKYFVCNNRLAGARHDIQSNFIHNADQFKYLDMACFDCVIKANAYYDGSDVFDKPDALGVAYVEYDAKYKNEEGSIGTSYGIADASFDYYPEQAEQWVIPVFSEDAFISVEVLNKGEKGIASYYNENHAKTENALYSLTISRDVEGRYQQSISNSKGLVLATWRMLSGKEYIVRNEYNEYDQLISSTPNNNPYLKVTYKYDIQGAPSVVLFGKHLLAASSLVLIFLKKLVFYLLNSVK